MSGLFVWARGRPTRCISGSGRIAPAHQKKEHKNMYKIYILKNKKKILKQTTRSYSNVQAFLYALRKRGYVCLVEYPGRKP
jgi:hypothetical protein